MHRLTDAKFTIREKIMFALSLLLCAILIITVYKSSYVDAKYTKNVNICNSKPCIELRICIYLYLVVRESTPLSYITQWKQPFSNKNEYIKVQIFLLHYQTRQNRVMISLNLPVRIGLRLIQCLKVNLNSIYNSHII